MAWKRPPLSDLIARINADFAARVPGLDPPLRVSLAGILATAEAGLTHELHGFQLVAARELMPDTAVDWLDRHASLWGLSRKQAAFAQGIANATGTNGTIVPADTILRRADGVEYRVTAEATVAGGTVALALEAVEPGVPGNAGVNTVLRLVSPIAGLAASATVAETEIGQGADPESDEDLRARLIARIQAPPHGGARSDYEAWALEVPGVTRAWIYPMAMGPGTVTVRFMCDGREDPIPTAEDVDAVQALIELRRPVTAEAFVVAPVANPMALTIKVVPGAGTTLADARAAVVRELRDLLAREAVPGGTILLSRIREAVSIAAGESDNAVTVPAADFASGTGEIATLGDIAWVAP